MAGEQISTATKTCFCSNKSKRNTEELLKIQHTIDKLLETSLYMRPMLRLYSKNKLGKQGVRDGSQLATTLAQKQRNIHC
jgi:hypothetical protein